MTEFNLSEKIKEINVIGEYFIPKDIKEFIKMLKEECRNKNWSAYGTIREDELDTIIDKLAGDSLK